METLEHLQEHEAHHDHDHEHDHQAEVLKSWAKSVLLVGLALYFVYNILSGNLTNYINQRFSWLSYVAVGLFLLLGVANVLELLREREHKHKHKRKHDDEDYHDHEHEHDHTHAVISWPVLAVIAVPLVLGTLVPSRPLGSAAVDGNISVSAVSVTNSTTFTTDPLQWNVLDWLRAFNNSTDINSFNGKEAQIIGFIYKEPTYPNDQVMVARFTVSCCVADASAIGLPVKWDKAPDLAQDTWVQVKGTFQVGDFRGNTVPILNASSVEVVNQPEHPYLYP
jgi:uncharacterized repeat protein (TIGR03943 family)